MKLKVSEAAKPCPGTVPLITTYGWEEGFTSDPEEMRPVFVHFCREVCSLDTSLLPTTPLCTQADHGLSPVPLTNEHMNTHTAWPSLPSFAALQETALPGTALLFTLFIVICAFYTAFLAPMCAISTAYFKSSPVFQEVKIKS